MTTRKSSSQTQPSDGESKLVGLDSAVFNGVSVTLDARLGSASMTVDALLALRSGQVLTLDSPLNDLVELHLNGALVGRGEIVAVGDHFGVRIVEVATAT